MKMLSTPPTLSGQAHSSRLAIQYSHVLKYIVQRALAVSLTIVAGVFLTVVIANHLGMLDALTQRHPAVGGAPEAFSLSFWPRHLFYTWKSLSLDWGHVGDMRKFNTWLDSGAGIVNTPDSRTIILSRLPATFLLSGAAFLLLALIGIPAALFLSQREGHWLDRLVGFLTPLSSVPSWVIGVLLVLLFAVQVKWFPAGKMYDAIPPQTPLETIRVVAFHLVLPATAIVISLIFQLIYSWRTYLMIYANEDYVTLAQAKGLKKGALNAHYILRPALPYMLTSLALTLVGFWQLTTALEFFFQWPGIGKLFADAMPNFHSEVMYQGEMTIVLGIVVLFAYILGMTVFLLDFLYLLVDPRIRIKTDEQPSSSMRIRQERVGRPARKEWRSQAGPGPAQQAAPRPAISLPGLIKSAAGGLQQAFRSAAATGRQFWAETRHATSARLGLGLAALLVIVSILVLIFIPYDPVAKEWGQSSLTGYPTTAESAMPLWVNWFRSENLPTTIILDSQEIGVEKRASSESAAMSKLEFELVFDYPYREFPSELALYLRTDCAEKMPFVTPYWVAPDGREIEIKSATIAPSFSFPLAQNIPVSKTLRQNERLKSWFETTGSQQTPPYYLLFADPLADGPRVLPGQYTLRVSSLFFEQGCDLDAKLVVFGLVEGWAGTDNLRRDLLIPLLWGLPVALGVGVFGAVATSIISLILAAASAWKGGWVDYLVQRGTEANLVMPVMAISVLLYAYLGFSMWTVIGLIILSNVLGSSTRVFRAALLQEREAGYILAARAYGASDWRIIRHYLVRRIIPVVVPQTVLLIPSFLFLEATLAIFNVMDVRYPTWGRMIYTALRYGSMSGSKLWVLEPILLMLMTGFVFILISFGLNRVLAPHLKDS